MVSLILVPTDGSARADRAVQFAADVTMCYDARKEKERPGGPGRKHHHLRRRDSYLNGRAFELPRIALDRTRVREFAARRLPGAGYAHPAGWFSGHWQRTSAPGLKSDLRWQRRGGGTPSQHLVRILLMHRASIGAKDQ